MNIFISEGAPKKVTMDRKEEDYQQQKLQAERQADGNPYVSGIQAKPPEAPEPQRTRYGNVNSMPQVREGINSGFQQTDNPGNRALDDPSNTSGSVDLGTSATASASEDPKSFQSDALNRRLDAYSKAMGNADLNLNDHSRTTRTT